MNYFRCGGGKTTHTASQITVAKTPLATFQSNASGLYLPEILAYIQATQAGSGDPSPINQRLITGWSAVNVGNSGKNLYNKNATGVIANYYLDEDGNETSNKYFSISDYIKVDGYSNITVSGSTNSGNAPSICFYDGAENFISGVKHSNNLFPHTYTVPTGAVYLRESISNAYIDTFQLELGSTATAYEPYTGQTATINLGQTVYGGTLNVGTGLLTVLGKYFVFNSAEYYGTYGYDDAPLFYVDITGEGIARMENTTYDIFLISNMLSKISTAATRAMENYEIRTDASDTPTKLYFRMDDYTSKTDIDAFLANNPLQVVAELATPQTYQLTPAQLEQLLGQNNVFCSSGDVAVKFWKID